MNYVLWLKDSDGKPVVGDIRAEGILQAEEKGRALAEKHGLTFVKVDHA